MTFSWKEKNMSRVYLRTYFHFLLPPPVYKHTSCNVPVWSKSVQSDGFPREKNNKRTFWFFCLRFLVHISLRHFSLAKRKLFRFVSINQIFSAWTTYNIAWLCKLSDAWCPVCAFSFRCTCTRVCVCVFAFVRLFVCACSFEPICEHFISSGRTTGD